MNNWDIKNIPSQDGKVALVTGANSGIGYETALAFAKKKMTVILACRNLEKGHKAKNAILKSFTDAQIEVMQIDTSILKSVRNFSSEFLKKIDRLDLLVNNAGIMMSPHKVTEDGFENQFATNYLGHFALTGKLMPLLLKTDRSRIITLSSLSYKWSEIQFEDMHFKKGYNKKKAYGQSKRACLIFAYELQRRLLKAQANTISIAVHPGLSKTNLDRYFPKLIRPLGALFLQHQSQGALPVLYAALENSLKGGEFIGPDGFQEMRGNPMIVDSDDYSKNTEIAERLWKASEDMTNESYL